MKKRSKKHQRKSRRGSKDAIGNRQKPRLSLMPMEAMYDVGDALTYGETHYGTSNWKKGIPVSYLIDAALRHLLQFASGEDLDKDSKCPHLGSAMANISFASWMMRHKKKMDDRMK